jgi:NAD(P)-dependent dehydrogenase (short-subunit alcohol dehydrogenase family)
MDDHSTGGARPTALVTGGSRGVGAATVRLLARQGCDVVFTYRNKAKRAAAVARSVELVGGRALPLMCDITNAAAVAELARQIGAWASRLDLLVLNASGGLEPDLLAADPEYPLRINRDAQVQVVEALLPLMPGGAQLVFVTSHWAHRYGQTRQLPNYEPIAGSKHAGETAMRARQAELAARGIRLLVVTADVIEGTITARLLERKAPGTTAGWQRKAGTLPQVEDIAAGIVAAVGDASLPTGHTVVVGAPLETLDDG